MGGLDPDRLGRVLEKLGQGHALSEHGLVLKPWPSCGYTHRIMTCALALRERVTVEDIQRIDLNLPDFHAAVLPFSQPTQRAEALFSLPFVSAMGLAEGGLTLADLEASTWEKPQIADLISKTHVHPFAPKRPDLNYAEDDPDRMIVTLADGTQHDQHCAFPFGSPQAPMAEGALWAKFTANTGPAPKAWAEALRHWPDTPNILPLLTGKGSHA